MKIKIDKTQNKVSKNDKVYLKVNDKYTCFEQDIIEKIKENMGKEMNLKVEESNGYFNIRGILNDNEIDETPKQQERTEEQKGNNRHSTMYVSYAKDIFCALVPNNEKYSVEELMGLSIGLVKQAKKHFE
jgi:hypothetical protein